MIGCFSGFTGVYESYPSCSTFSMVLPDQSGLRQIIGNCLVRKSKMASGGPFGGKDGKPPPYTGYTPYPGNYPQPSAPFGGNTYGPYPQEPPPPYSAAINSAGMPAAHNPYPVAPPYGYNPNPQYYPPGFVPVNSTVVMPEGFDPGARFGAGARPNIPPPPPGAMPNPAQLAMMQGSNVVVGQKKGSFVTGGPGGGATFW